MNRCISSSKFVDWVHKGVRMNGIKRSFVLDPLSVRELEILRLIEGDFTNREDRYNH